MGRKDRCALFGCNNDCLFPRNISSLFARKERVHTERVPPGHPIILLKSNKFNMAAVSVKRSIDLVVTIVRRNLIQLYWSPLRTNLPYHGTQFDIALRNHALLAQPSD